MPTPRLSTACVIACVSLAASCAAQADTWLRLTDFTLIDGTGAPARPVSTLLARNGTIVGIDEKSADRSAQAFDTVTHIALDGAFVIPGLIDSHVHLSGFPGDRDGLPARMQQALRGGVTSVRDMAGDTRVLSDVQRAMHRDEFPGLTIAYAALMGGMTLFTDPRVTAASVGHAPGTAPWQQAITAQTDLALAVAMARGTGATGIKLYGNLDASQVAAIGAEAKRQGIAVWAHATVFPARPSDLLTAGADVLSHAPYLIWEAVDEVPGDYGARREGPYDDISPRHPKIRALLRRMAKNQTLLDTTLLIYRDAITMAEGEQRGAWARKAYAWGVDAVRLAHELGVPLAAGTDRFLKDELSLPDLHEELVILVRKAGLDPMDALIAATRNAARAAGLTDSRGTIETGKAADFVVVENDPLTDIAATRQIRLVIKDGRIVFDSAMTPS